MDFVLYSCDKTAQFDKDVKFINVQKYSKCIINIADESLGIMLIKSDKYDMSQLEIIKQIQSLKRNGASQTIFYIEKGEHNFKEYTTFIKLVAKSGASVVVGIDDDLQYKRNIRRFDFKDCKMFYSLGSIHEEDEENSKKNIAITAIMKMKQGNIIQEGYIPLILKSQKDNLLVKDFYSYEDVSDVAIIQEKYLSNKCRNFNYWNARILLKDIMEVLQRELPDKYKHLGEYTINKINARTYELAPGDIFFFREPFNDKNDLKKENEFVRLKLIFKALMRRSVFIVSYRPLWNKIPHIVESSTIEAHIKVMAWYRQKQKTKYIGITGSIGKTSTKDMLYCILNKKYRTGKSERNSNVQVKIGLNIQRVNRNLEYFIQEIGGGRPGGASRHSRMIRPSVAVVTNIGTAHIGNYETQEDLMRHKLNIAEGFDENGVLFLNGDDELLKSAETKYSTVYYAIHNKEADYYADNISEIDGKTYFDIVYGNNRVNCVLNVMGEHNVLNATGCFAIGKYLGMKDEEMIEGMLDFKTEGIRQNIIEIAGHKLFVDCYNASLDSMESSLRVLENIECLNGKRIAIIGDITGMGDKQEVVNEELARILEKANIDEVVCYGNEAQEIKNAIKPDADIAVKAISEYEELKKWIEMNATKEDVVLFKGSSKMKLDECIDDVFGTYLSNQRYIDEGHFSSYSKKGFKYNIFESFITLTKYTGHKSNMVLLNSLFGKPLTKIKYNAFKNNTDLKEITLGDNIIHIGSECFMNCINLETVNINKKVKFIGKMAFANCVNLKSIQLPNSVMAINKGAFANCENLEVVYMPKNIDFVDERAFENTKARIEYI